MTNHQLALKIARRLFTSGGAPTVGKYPRAQRLVLTVDKPKFRTLGGWNFSTAVLVIERIISDPKCPF